MVGTGPEIHLAVKQEVLVPYRKLVENIVHRPGCDSSQKSHVPYGELCIESTKMKQPNSVQAMRNMVDSVQQGSGLLSVRRRVYSTGLPELLKGLGE